MNVKSASEMFELVPPPITTTGYAYKGISAACDVCDDGTGVIVITAPSSQVLEKVWALLFPDKELDSNRVKTTASIFNFSEIEKPCQAQVQTPSRRRVAPPVEDDLPWDDAPQCVYTMAYDGEGCKGIEGPTPNITDLLTSSPPLDAASAYIFEWVGDTKKPLHRWHNGRQKWMPIC